MGDPGDSGPSLQHFPPPIYLILLLEPLALAQNICIISTQVNRVTYTKYIIQGFCMHTKVPEEAGYITSEEL